MQPIIRLKQIQGLVFLPFAGPQTLQKGRVDSFDDMPCNTTIGTILLIDPTRFRKERMTANPTPGTCRETAEGGELSKATGCAVRKPVRRLLEDRSEAIFLEPFVPQKLTP